MSKKIVCPNHLNNGWMNFYFIFFISHNEYRLKNGLLRFAKSEKVGAQYRKNIFSYIKVLQKMDRKVEKLSLYVITFKFMLKI